MKNHKLKCEPRFFEPVVQGLKNFEVRRDDRKFKVGDTITLQEWLGSSYTGREWFAEITYILRDFPNVESGYVVLALG